MVGLGGSNMGIVLGDKVDMEWIWSGGGAWVLGVRVTLVSRCL
jgi:hypothetical protein